MPRPRRAMHEVPGTQPALPCLRSPAHTRRRRPTCFPGRTRRDRGPLTPATGLGYEIRAVTSPALLGNRCLPALLALDPRDIAGIDHEPPLALRDEARVGLLQLCFSNGSAMSRDLQNRAAFRPIDPEGWASNRHLRSALRCIADAGPGNATTRSSVARDRRPNRPSASSSETPSLGPRVRIATLGSCVISGAHSRPAKGATRWRDRTGSSRRRYQTVGLVECPSPDRRHAWIQRPRQCRQPTSLLV